MEADRNPWAGSRALTRTGSLPVGCKPWAPRSPGLCLAAPNSRPRLPLPSAPRHPPVRPHLLQGTGGVALLTVLALHFSFQCAWHEPMVSGPQPCPRGDTGGWGGALGTKDTAPEEAPLSVRRSLCPALFKLLMGTWTLSESVPSSHLECEPGSPLHSIWCPTASMWPWTGSQWAWLHVRLAWSQLPPDMSITGGLH